MKSCKLSRSLRTGCRLKRTLSGAQIRLFALRLLKLQKGLNSALNTNVSLVSFLQFYITAADLGFAGWVGGWLAG